MDGRTHARTGVTLNAPPPFFEWRDHKNGGVSIGSLWLTKTLVLVFFKQKLRKKAINGLL